MNGRYTSLAALALMGCFAQLVEAQRPETPPPPRTITVAGTAVTKVVPDMVVWHVNTQDCNPILVTAKESSDQKLKSILGLKQELGLKDEDLQTGWLSIEREYHRDAHGNRTEFKHFTVRRSVTIKQRDISRFDEFLSRLVGSAEMEVSFELQSSRIHELRADTRLKAVSLARGKAEAMTNELGAKLGKVLTISEFRPDATTSSWPQQWANSNAMWAAPEPSALEVDVASGTFAPGSIEIRVTVYATFEIE